MIPVDTVADFFHSLRSSFDAMIFKNSDQRRDSLETSEAKVNYLTKDEFSAMLEEVKRENDPFTALAQKITRKKTQSCCIVKLATNDFVECVLSEGKWDSTTFKNKQPGKFRFIKFFEYNSESSTHSKTKLVNIRISQDHSEGEWLSINKVKQITGNQAKELAEKVSRAMRIKKCFLTDSATVTLPNGVTIALRIPLQVIRGHGYYSPLFSMAKADKIDSLTTANSRTKTYLKFNQNPEKHQEELQWLQGLKILDVYNKIINKSAKDKKELSALAQRTYLVPLNQCSHTLQDLMTTLYERKNNSEQAQNDYVWASYHLITHTSLKGNSDIQIRYKNITKALDINMLLVASFG